MNKIKKIKALYDYLNVSFSKEASQISFFAESKVRSNSGDLLPLYHGTNKEFSLDKIHQSRDGALGAGIYLTPLRERAREYGDRIINLYANIKNPIIIKLEAGNKILDPCVEALVLMGMMRDKAESKVEKAYEQNGYISSQIKVYGQKLGYDGILLYRNEELQEVVVWNKEQLIQA